MLEKGQNQAMHLSREMRRFEIEDLSSRRGDRNRSPTEDARRPQIAEIQRRSAHCNSQCSIQRPQTG
jgi:hypothetical protein